MTIFAVELGVDSQKVLNLILKASKPLKELFLNIGPIDVDRFLDWNLNWDLSINMHRHFPIDINRLVDIDNFLGDHWHLDCPDDLSGNFLDHFNWHLFLHLNILWYLNNLLDNPFRSRDWFGHLNNDLEWFLNHDLLYDFFGYD
jgi:hypothetical protein